KEKFSFMHGLTGVLDRFSEGLCTWKILPSLLEEVRVLSLFPIQAAELMVRRFVGR
ncbi:uncharacterized protein F5147DRAFT_570285, partial [Suillus discolor]